MSAAQVVVSGARFDETSRFLETHGFRLELIAPADDPAVAVFTGHGISVRVDRSVAVRPTQLRIVGEADRSIVGPSGLELVIVADADTLVIPDAEHELVVNRADDDGSWVIGRAGMRYRDLIPSRLGGRFIASHIEVCDGGPVPDVVHHHSIRFQLIWCRRGWVDVVYEDQGPAFRMHAGDAVLQPPHIRHRVLASSAGAQVVEIGCPAEHDTLVDHQLVLPNDRLAPQRMFGGQRFVRHVGAQEPWIPDVVGFDVQETAIAEATHGLAAVGVRRRNGDEARPLPLRHTGEFRFVFVLGGSVTFVSEGNDPVPLTADDSVSIPPHVDCSFEQPSGDFEVLEVRLPRNPADR